MRRGSGLPPRSSRRASCPAPLERGNPATPQKRARDALLLDKMCILWFSGGEKERGAGRLDFRWRRRLMSLSLIVKTLGGDLYDRGRRANIPAPGHSAADRSVSLLLEDNRIVVHTFGDGDWRAVLDHLRAHKLIDAGNAPLSIAGEADVAARVAAAPAGASERLAAARRLW